MIQTFLFLVVIPVILYKILRRPVTVLRGMAIHHPPHVTSTLLEGFAPLEEWQKNLSKGLLVQGVEVKKVTVREAYMFGPRIGFLFLDADLVLDGRPIPGAVLLRGASVSALLWYRVSGVVHVVMVRQPRVATGRMVWEVPAGMADGEGTLKGQMFKEIYEETGLTFNTDDLICHGSRLTSCGILDEDMVLYSKEIDPPSFSLNGKFGNVDEDEMIVGVDAVSLDDPRSKEDGKLAMLLSVVFGRDGCPPQ